MQQPKQSVWKRREHQIAVWRDGKPTWCSVPGYDNGSFGVRRAAGSWVITWLRRGVIAGTADTLAGAKAKVAKLMAAGDWGRVYQHGGRWILPRVLSEALREIAGRELHGV
jgi:hypothetical protein